MRNRSVRSLALALVTGALSLLMPFVGGCRTQAPGEVEEAKKPPRPESRTFTVEGTEILESYTNDAPDSAPIVVAIHGRGDSPTAFSALYKRYAGKVHVLAPKGYAPFGDGFSWFELREGMTDAELGASVGAAAERLHKSIAAAVGGKRYVVTGFSQGGILSYAFASKYAAELVCALPIAGSLPGPLLPGPKQKAAKTRAFHGEADSVIASKWGTATVETFVREGGDATLKTYPGLGHQFNQELMTDYFTALDGCVGVSK
jgi:phospholipase/carboxylesterase